MGLPVSNTDDFFHNEQTAASAIKTKIVVDYFIQWARIVANVVRKNPTPSLRYVDLFAGPGRFGDGAPSTPLLIVEHAIKTPDLCSWLTCHFNDVDPDHIEKLKKNIKALPSIEKLTNQPRVRVGEIDEKLVAAFAKRNQAPSFSFIDPFGYKGLSLKLVEALVGGWGSDIVLFFSYDSINRALTNKHVTEHVDALFGKKRADELRAAAKEVATSPEREELLIEKFIEAVNEDLGYDFVIPYVFEKEKKDRTSHYLIFISKDKRGFSIMKEIMYAQSDDRTQGVARFGYVREVSRKRTPLLALMNTPLEDFKKQLCEEFAGQNADRKTLRDQFDTLHPRNLFVEKNWRDALSQLEVEGKVTCVPPRSERRVQKGEFTFGPNTVVAFPKER
jgi:three-Cys-motif partner protein